MFKNNDSYNNNNNKIMFKNNDSYNNNNNNNNNIMTMVDDQTILPIINNNIKEKQKCNDLNINNNSNTTQNTLNRPIEIIAAATRNSRNKLNKHNEKPYNRKEVRFNLKDNPKPIQTAAMSHNNINNNTSDNKISTNNSINNNYNNNINNKNNIDYSNTNANNNYNNINNHKNNKNNEYENNNKNKNNKINHNIDNYNDNANNDNKNNNTIDNYNSNNDFNENKENNTYDYFKENTVTNNDDNTHNNTSNTQRVEREDIEPNEDVIMIEESEDDEDNDADKENYNSKNYNNILPGRSKNFNNIIKEKPDMVSNSENRKTEKLEYLDPSFITEKNIRNVKGKNREEKIKDIKNKAKKINTDIEQSETSFKKPEKHIKLMEKFGDYYIQDLIKEIASTDVITKLVYLLDLFPKFRTEFLKALKLAPKQTITNVMTVITKHKIIKVCGKVENNDCEIFLDTCASVNFITRSALNKLKINKPSIGRISETIFQAYSNSSTESDIYDLQISIGSKTFNEYFRVIEKDDIFDILIGVDSLKNNRFDINLVDDTLYYIDENNNYIKLADLFYDINLNNTYKDDEDIEKHQNTKSEPFLLTITVTNDKEITNTNELPNTKEHLINEIISSVPNKFKNKISKLFFKFKNVVAIKTDDLGRSKLLPHRIELIPKSSPIKLKAYRLSKAQTKALKEILIKLIENKLIEPSYSSWAFPVVLVPKKNGDWRMCVDFRALNNITIKDSYALPLIDDILMFIGKNAKILSTIDLFSGYHQVPMNPDDKDKTTFTTMFGNYKFCVMPFGLCNAPATFQREMNRIFFDLIGVCLFVYIDDLVIFSDSIESHITHLTKVFQILADNGLKINLEKCSFFKEEVVLLGHVLSTKGIAPIPDKIKVIINWLPPKNITQLKSFLGAVGYYRKFIKNFAQIANPLFNLLKKDVPYEWSEKCNIAFEKLKMSLTVAPILTPPDYSKPFIIRTDASRDGLGGVLLQTNENSIEIPIYFESRTLSAAESNYSVTDLEGKAIFHCVKKFKPYFSGSPFTTIVYTDHKPLVSIFANREPSNNRHLKWVTELSILNVQVQFQEGKKNVIADALSRLPTKEIHENKEILNALVNNDVLSNNSNDSINKFMNEFINKRIINIDGVEYLKQGEQLRRIVHNKEEKQKLIEEAHGLGHEGAYKTYSRLKRDYYWGNMKKDIQILIKCCHKCQTCRPQKLNKYTENIATVPEYPFSRVGLDLIGPLPITNKGNRYIIVLVDYLTKWVEAEPLQSAESQDVINFLKKIFARHGVPEILVTDNGPQFTSDKTKAFLDLNDIYVNYVATYHPSSNGEVENRNREIGKYLRLLGEEDSQWDETLYSALWALRTCKNEVTKHSSFELLYGRRDLQPFELTVNVESKNDWEDEEEFWLRKFINHDRWIREAIKNIETANKLWEDRRKQIKRMRAKYKPGDLVLVKLFNRKKLDPFFTGPLKIVKQEFNTVTVCDPVTGEVADRNIHLKNIIPYFTELNLEE